VLKCDFLCIIWYGLISDVLKIKGIKIYYNTFEEELIIWKTMWKLLKLNWKGVVSIASEYGVI
jgi:hypothetical protein